MNPQERQIIDDLFDKLRQAELQAGPREPLAEAHIRSRIANQPGAPYLMAQTIVMQQQALEAAEARLTALEEEAKRRPASGGFLSGLFGGGSSGSSAGGGIGGGIGGGVGGVGGGVGGGREPGASQGTPRPDTGFGSRSAGQDSAFGRSGAQAQPGRGGGFLAGAAQTAMGVAGGMLLGSMIGSALGGGAAHAAHAAAPEHQPTDDLADNSLDDAADDPMDDSADFGDDLA